MKTLIIGTGGVGGALGAFLAKAGNDVTFIARGEHLNAMRTNGLRVKSGLLGDFVIEQPKACTMEEYEDTPDVIFVCVKGYSSNAAAALIRRVATRDTVVIPLLNVVSTGEELRRQMPDLHITDGCIYIFAKIIAPGEIEQSINVFKVVFGEPDGSVPETLNKVAQMLRDSGIHVDISDDIRRDCFQKLAIVSPLAATGSYYNATAEKIRTTKEMLDDFVALTQEIIDLSNAMGIRFNADMIEKGLKNITNAAPEATASMHRDILKGGDSEIDGLVFEIVRLGKQYGVETPVYAKIARHFGYTE